MAHLIGLFFDTVKKVTDRFNKHYCPLSINNLYLAFTIELPKKD